MNKYIILIILILSHSSIHAEKVKLLESKALTCSEVISECSVCTSNNHLFKLKKFSNNLNALEVEADQSEVSSSGEYLITGNVSIASHQNFLGADKVLISSENNTSSAFGSVKYQDKDFLLQGSELTIKKQDNDNVLVDVSNAKFQDLKTMANGMAKSAHKENSFLILNDSTYSFCPINKGDWYISAKKINLDLDNNRALADKATLKFFDIPIIYLPKYSWVTSGRGSGFLSPSLNIFKDDKSSSSEFYSRTPYYFDIAPDRDLLLALSILSNRGEIYEGKYRQLISNKSQDDGLFEIEAQYLFGDKITNKNRWLLESSIGLELNSKMHLDIKYSRVSDKNYFKDILRSRTSEERLSSYIKFEHNNPALPEKDDSDKLDIKKIQKVNYGRNRIGNEPGRNHSSFFISSEQEQLINSGIPNYTKSLESAFFSRRTSKLSPNTLDFGIIATNFQHEDKTKDTGLRTHGEINLKNNLNVPGPFSLNSNSSISLSNYFLKEKNNESRISGSLKLGLSLPITKSRSFLGKSGSHLIEPKITYHYTPKLKQSKLPLFDTNDNNSDILTPSILLGKRYNGIDRINNENDISLSLESSFVDNISENKLINFNIAQRYYGDDESVSDTENQNYDKIRRYSDIISNLDISLGKYQDFKASIKAQYDPEIREVSKNELALSYSPHQRKFFAISRTDDNTSQNLIYSGAYPFSNRIHIFGGIDKSLDKNITNKETIGIAFEDCCWSARIVHFKEAINDNVLSYDYSTGFELVFTGLGSSDSSIRNRIKENLPNYKVKLSEQNSLLTNAK
jgi:LPS-assembly protein